MTEHVVSSSSAEQTAALGQKLGEVCEPGDVILLSGDLGAGKTQLTKGIARGLAVEQPITSPTFNLMLVHPGRLDLFHFDLYRLDHPDQLDDLDYHGVLEGVGVSVVEWAAKFTQATPASALVVDLRITGDDERSIQVRAVGARGESLMARWLEALAS